MRAHALLTALTLALAGPALAAPLPSTPVPDARAAQAPTVLVPQPQQQTLGTDILPLAGLGVRVVGDAPQLQWAARDLRDEFKVRLGQELATGGRTPITIGTRADATLARLATEKGLLTDQPEGYALWVDATGAYVVGADAQGAYHGAQTLRQLLTSRGLRHAAIKDWPAMRNRMAMIYLDQYSKGVNDFLIPLLAKLKYNGVLVMSNYVQWDTAKKGGFAHPGGASKAEAQRVANLAREHGLEPVPLVETLGHVAWMFYGGKNRDLVQDPLSQNPFAYDTLNPRTYDEVILPILSEAVDVFRPKYVHIGHDEVFNVDRFPARDNGKAVGAAKLFIDDTLKLHAHLKAKNVGTMIWHDVAFADAYRDVIPPALPKDIVVSYWNYSPSEDYPLLSTIRQAGFPTFGAPWRDPMNPETFAKSILKHGAVGGILTRWSGYFGNPSLWDGQADQGVAYVRGSAFWNPAGSVLAAPEARYRDLYRPASYLPVGGRLVDLSSRVTRSLTDKDETGWIQKGPDTDLGALPTGVTQVGQHRFLISGAVMTKGSRAAARDLPDRVPLEIGAKADSLAFLHTTGWSNPANRERVGAYEIEYDDGTKSVMPVEYGRHVRAWNDMLPTSMVLEPAWAGKTRDGLDVNLGVLTWTNPHPQKTIRSVTVVSDGKGANLTLIGLTLVGSGK